MGSGHADASKPASATLTFQTAVRREWHDGTGFKSDESLTGPTDMPDPDDRRLWHRERGSVDVAPRVRLFPLERATSPPDTHSVVPVYVLTVAVDETRTGRRLWQGKVSYRGAIANDDATAFDALLPRLVQNIGHTVRAEGFELN